MSEEIHSFVFLTECADFSEARVVKSFLESQGFHPRVRDEQLRSVAPHLGDALGKLILEVPEHEFLQASQSLENVERPREVTSLPSSDPSQDLAKKTLLNAILGVFVVPVLCNVYSMILGFRVLGREMPLSKKSRQRLTLAMVFNAFAFYFWLIYGFKWLRSLILVSLLLFVSPSFGMVIVGFDSEPFYFKNGSEGISGACYEILQKFCEQEKVHCKFKIAPLPVVLEMIKNGKADVTCPLSETVERTEYIAYSDKIFKTRFAFFGMPEVAGKVATLRDLSGLSVGVFTPSRVSESLDEIRKEAPVKFEVIKETSNVSTLLRAEKISKVLAYMNQEIGSRWIEKSKSPLIVAPLKGEEVSYNIGFSKKNLSAEKIKGYIKTVHEIVGSDEIQESVAKLGLTLWAEKSAETESAEIKPNISPTSSVSPAATVIPASAIVAPSLPPTATPSPAAPAKPTKELPAISPFPNDM